MKIWQSLWILDRKKLSLKSEYTFLTNINLTWFLIYCIIIPLNMPIGMNGLSLSMICILVHNYYNRSSLWMVQITNGRNGNQSNLMIIYPSNFDMPVWGCIDDEIILTSDTSISTPEDKWLKICEVVVGFLDKRGVNLTINFSINSDLFHTLCRGWIGDRNYLTYILKRNLEPIVKVGKYHGIITIIIIFVFYSGHRAQVTCSL